MKWLTKPIILKTFCINLLIFSDLGTPPTWGAETEFVGLPAGAALPSNNSAILQNPAALSQDRSKVFDLSSSLDFVGSPNMKGTFTYGFGNFGFGVEVNRLSDSFLGSAAVSATVGKSSFGINISTYLPSFMPTFGVGFRHEFKSFLLAIVVDNLVRPLDNWTLGFGFPAGSNLRFGLDFDFSNYTGSFFGVSDMRAVANAHIFVSKSFSFLLTYQLPVLPYFTFSSEVGAGLSGWISKKVVLYGLYRHPNYDTIIGLKFLL